MRKFLTILPYKRTSEGSRMLAKGLGIHRMPDPGLIRGGHHVINWGCSDWAPPVACRVYNHPAKVRTAINKLSAFQRFEYAHVSIPRYTTDINVAKEWVRKGSAVVCRQSLTATEGRGASVADKEVDVVPAKLYTSYVPKKREYRVHVAFGKVIGYKRKIKHKDVPIDGDERIRNHANGFRFIIDPQNPPAQVILDEAVKAVDALGLDFGGVDVMWTEKKNKAFVLEVNCAPGMTDSVVDWYVKAFKEKYGNAA